MTIDILYAQLLHICGFSVNAVLSVCLYSSEADKVSNRKYHILNWPLIFNNSFFPPGILCLQDKFLGGLGDPDISNFSCNFQE